MALWISAIFFYSYSFFTGNTGPESTVYIFLHDECVISRYYTLPLNSLYDTFQETSEFVGVFPNPQVDEKRLRDFKEKYNLEFDLTNDPDFDLVDRFGATVTPEVVVLNNANDQVVYKGRIDNAYARVGKKRSIVTSHELEEVLTSLRNKEQIKTLDQPAIGCIITKVN